MARAVYGINPVRELLRTHPRSIQALYLSRSKSGGGIREIRADAKKAGVKIEEKAPGDIDGLAGDGARHQGVVAVTGEFEYADLAEVLQSISISGENALIVVLDHVQDPHNLGAVIRSAAVFGAHAVVVGKDRSARVTGAVVKASAGATERLPVCQVVNIARALDQCKAQGLWPVAAVMNDAQEPSAIDLRVPTVLVLGSEGEGIRSLVEKACDFRVRIPMATDGIASLNVSVAAGVLLYEAARQRGASSPSS
jgi:23S rRNA (guanosine2251-2'-O)-methyltransferase